jgi:hypothetical protein
MDSIFLARKGGDGMNFPQDAPKTPALPAFKKLRQWSGWPACKVAGGVIVLFVGLTLLNGKQPTQPKNLALIDQASEINARNEYDQLLWDNQPARFEDTRQASHRRRVLPPLNIDSVEAGDVGGRKTINIRAVPHGPIIIVDLETGKVIEERDPMGSIQGAPGVDEQTLPKGSTGIMPVKVPM